MLPKPFYIEGNLDSDHRIAGSFSIHLYLLWGPVNQTETLAKTELTRSNKAK